MEDLRNFRTLLIATAVCSFLGALTTTLLIFLPNPEAPDFEASVRLHGNALYLFKQWLLFFHPQVNLLAALGIAFLLIRKYPLSIVFGTVFLVLWAFSEISQQALNIDALNQLWRPGYTQATDPEARKLYETLIRAANGLSDSKYFLVLYGFGLGSLFYGWAFVREQGWTRWIGAAYLFIGVLSCASFLRYYLGAGGLNDLVNWAYRWIYAYLQPLVRVAVGIWIFSQIRRISRQAEAKGTY